MSFVRMLLHGFLHTFTGNNRYPHVKFIYPIWILMYILTTQGIAQAAYYGESKAVFNKPCTEIMTLSSPVPSLTQFTLCTYIKLESSNPWTAFTYKLPLSQSNVYEIGLLGDSSSIKIWMFGTPIIVLKSLNLHTWYEMCIKWSAKTGNMAFYIDGNLEEQKKLNNSTKLQEGGNVVLGCSKYEEFNSTIPVGLEGELYMFRMWNTVEVSFFQKCIDGNVIKWDIGNWIYSPDVVQHDPDLPCAKQQPENPTNSQIIHMLYKRAANAPENNSTSTTNMPLTAPNTTDAIGILNNSMTTVNTYIPTDYINTTTGTDYTNTTTGNMTCVSNASMDVQNLYARICSSNFSCNGTVYEVILQGNCTEPIQFFQTDPVFSNYTIYPTYFEGGCKVLINDSSIICKVETYFLPFHLYLQEKIAIDYCCCDECDQSRCFVNHTLTCGDPGTTTGLQTTGYSNSFSTIDKSTSNGFSATSHNLTTGNSQPFTTNNGANTTVTHTGTVSKSSAASNTTVYRGTTLVINSSSTTTTSFNWTSTDIGEPTTSHSSESTSTTHKRTDFTTLTQSSSKSQESSTMNKDTGSTTNESRTTSHESRTTSQASSTPGQSSSTTNNSSSTTNQSSISTSPSSNNTTQLFSSTTKLINIDHQVSILEDLLAGEVNITGATTMLGILDSILNSNQTPSTNASNRLIKIVDKIGLKINFPGQSINLTSQNLALAVSKVNASSFSGTSFGVESSSDLQVTLGSQLPGNSSGSVLLPASLLNDLSPADKDIASRVQFNYFEKTSFFQDSSLNSYQQLVSKVISSSVANLTVTNLKQNVTVTLKTSSHNDSGVLKCVFWDFTLNSGNGGWSSEGCTVNSTTQDNINQTVCKCNHLTSFGILLDMTPNNPISPEDKLILTFITYIGCGLSAIFLSVTLVTYIAFEKIRRDYPSKILIQLCAALIGLNLTFLMDPWIALYNDIPGLCISVAAFLHYFLLVSITWMGLEAFHMYLSLVKVFNTYVRKYILKFCIIGWGAPAVVVAIILAVNKDLYELQISEPYPNGASDYFCWMHDIIYWITVVGYFCVIFMLNVSMFVVVLIQLCRIKKQKQLGYQRKTLLQDVRSVAGITFLLGITWGLGFFTFGPGKTVIQYLFAIFNSLQGFFIFFFYCVAKENVRKQWRRYLCCGKFRLAENSDWSKTATNKLKKQTSKQGISSSSSNSIQSTSNSNSTTLLVSNEYSMHPNGNGNVFKERNGVTFMPQNGEVQLQEFPGRPATRNGDTQRTSLRRTSNRGSVHFVDQI